MSEILFAMGRGTPGHEQHGWRQRPITGYAELDPRYVRVDRVSVAGAIDLVIEPGPPALILAGPDELTVRAVMHRILMGTLRIELPARPAPVPGLLPSPFARRVVIGLRLPEVPNVVHEGEGDVYVYGVNQPELFLSHSGSGRLLCFGRAEGVAATLGGTGTIDATGLECGSAVAVLAGKGEVAVHARTSAHLTLRGEGCIRISGNPASVTRNLTGKGRIECR